MKWCVFRRVSVMPNVPRLTFHAFRRPSVVRNPSDTPLTIHDSIATGRRPRTIYHFTSVVAVVAWITALCYAMIVFRETGASLGANSFASAVQGSIMMSIIVWSAVVRTWWSDSRRLCIAFTLTLAIVQAVAIFTMGR